MFKLRFSFLFAVVFACNYHENSQAENPAVKQEGAIVEERAGTLLKNTMMPGLPKMTTSSAMMTNHQETSPKKKPLEREMTTEGSSKMTLRREVSAIYI